MPFNDAVEFVPVTSTNVVMFPNDAMNLFIFILPAWQYIPFIVVAVKLYTAQSVTVISVFA